MCGGVRCGKDLGGREEKMLWAHTRVQDDVLARAHMRATNLTSWDWKLLRD